MGFFVFIKKLKIMATPSPTHEEFVTRARLTHGDNFEYPEEYKGVQTPIDILCKIHGLFKQTPAKHYKSNGCNWCVSRGQKMSYERVSARLVEVHDGIFSIKEKDYITINKPMTVTCKYHGDFQAKLDNLFRKISCKKCNQITNRERKLKSHEQFLIDAQRAHGDKYKYPEQYIDATADIGILCDKHGLFKQNAHLHLRGRGCQKCARESQISKMTNTLDYVLNKMTLRHKGFYDYSLITSYTNNRDVAQIICPKPKHGIFKQKIMAHMLGQNCPKCANKMSKQTLVIGDLLTKHGFHVKYNDRVLLNGLEADIVVNSEKIAIEYNGLMVHREGIVKNSYGGGKDKHYHFNKYTKAQDKGYNLLHIFEDEWLEKKAIMTNIILDLFNVLPKLFLDLSVTKIQRLSNQSSIDFLDEFHIEGYKKSSDIYAMTQDDNILAIMSFNKLTNDSYKLERFATDQYHSNETEIAQTLLDQFIKEIQPKRIVSYLDVRFCFDKTNNIFTQLGFQYNKTLDPTYFLLNMSHGRAKRLSLKRQKPNISYDKIWNCGFYKFVKEI